MPSRYSFCCGDGLAVAYKNIIIQLRQVRLEAEPKMFFWYKENHQITLAAQGGAEGSVRLQLPQLPGTRFLV